MFEHAVQDGDVRNDAFLLHGSLKAFMRRVLIVFSRYKPSYQITREAPGWARAEPAASNSCADWPNASATIARSIF